MKKRIRLAALLAALVMLTSAAGCFAGSIDDLLSLPQPSEEYLHLQELINDEIIDGSEFSAPTSGSYRQSVQLYDLDGDGTNEALVFLRSADQTLKICVYRHINGDYEPAMTLEGEGTAIGSVDFANLNGDGSVELIVAWQVAADLRLLKVYSVTGWSESVLLTTDCSFFRVVDLTGSGASSLLNIRFDGNDGRGYVDMYSLSADNEMLMQSVQLSAGMLTVSSATSGSLADGVPALFVEGYIGQELYTDIITYTDDHLKNVALRRTTGVSTAYRSYPVFCTDLDGDKVVEVPYSEPLYSQSEGASTYWLFNWYTFNSHGRRTLDCSTYHCYNDGWYLVIPDSLRSDLTVRREDMFTGERVVVLSTVDAKAGAVEDIVKIYTLTGENRHDRARFAGRFILLENDTTIYAAELMGGDFTRDALIASFKVISADWNSGIS